MKKCPLRLSRRLLCRLATCLAAVVPAALPVQAQVTVSPFVATDTGLESSPPLVGASLSAATGALGVRASLSVDAGAGFFAPAGVAPTRVWSAELDGLTYIGATPRTHDLVPYFVAGFGLRALRESGAAPPIVTGSYGAGLHLRLTDRLGMAAEARYRAPLAAPAAHVPAGLTPGWEGRVGFTFRLGGGRRPRPLPPRYTPPAPHVYVPPAPLPPPTPPAAPPRARSSVAFRMIETGEAYLHVPYVWGGTDPDKGFDCSGFVRHVYRRHGVRLPRVSRDQAKAGTPLAADLSALEPGDLMFFATNGVRIDHVAIYAGDGRILHASKSKGRVGYDDLWTKRGGWYRRHFVAARRVLDARTPPDAE